MHVTFGGLVCVACGHDLELVTEYSGIDSSYPLEVSLTCPNCGRTYPICRVRRGNDIKTFPVNTTTPA